MPILTDSCRKILAIGVFSTTLLCACTSPYTPDFSGMSKQYANILEQYQIDMIFANIIRSSLDYPLSFLDMPNITGTGTISNTPTLTAGFAGTATGLAGPLAGTLATVTPSWSLQFGNSFNFSQSSLDNAVFWKAFLSQIQLDSVKYFIHNHIPRELIFSLLIDEIIVTRPDGTQKIYINNPLRAEHAEFQKELYTLLGYGLNVKPTFNATNDGLPQSQKDLEKTYGSNPKQALAERGMQLRQVSSGPTPLYQVIKLTPVYKLCLEKNEFENFVKEKYGTNILCQTSSTTEAATVNRTNEPELNIIIRSTKNIYDYLGQVVDAQLADPPYLVTVPPSNTTLLKKPGESNRFALLIVNRNADGKLFTSLEAPDDNVYSISRTNNGYSTLVINLLAQLQTLAKAPGSIPSSPAVLIH